MVVQIGCLLDQAPHGEGGALVIRGGGGGVVRRNDKRKIRKVKMLSMAMA